MARESNTYSDVINSVNDAYRTLVQGQLADAKTVASIVVARKNLRSLRGLMRSTVTVITEVTNTPDIVKKVNDFNTVFKTINIQQLTKSLQQFANIKISKKTVNQSLRLIDTTLKYISDIGAKYSKELNTNNLKKLLDSINELSKTAGDTSKNLLSISKDLKKTIVDLTIMSMTATVARPVMLAGIRSVQIVMTTLTATMKKINTRGLKTKANDLKHTLSAITGSIITFSLGLFAVSAILITKSKTMLAGLVAFGVVATTAVGIMYLLNKKSIKKTAKQGAATLMIISASFIGFALVTLILGKVNGSSLKALVGFTAVIGVAVGVLFLIDLVKRPAKQGVATLMLISISFIGFAYATLILGKVTGPSLTALVGFAAVVGIAVGVMVLLNLVKGIVFKGIVALAAIAGALVLFTIPVMLLSMIEPNWPAFGYFAAVVGTGIALCAGAGLAAALILPGAGVLAAVGGAMLLFATTLSKIVEVGAAIDDKKLKAFTDNIKPVVQAFKDGVKDLSFKDIIKINKLYRSISKSLLNIAKAYETISNLKVDYNAAAISVNKLVLSTINAFMDTAKDPEVQKMLAGNRNDSTVWKIIKMSKGMGNAITELASGVRDMAQMTVTEYDDNGKVKGKRHLTDEDLALAGDSVARIVTSFFTALQSTDNATLKEMLNGNIKKTTAWKAIEVAKEMGGAISQLALGVKDMSTMTFKDANGKEVRVDITKAVGNTTTLITGTLTSLNNIKFDTSMPKNLTETGKGLQKFAEATNGLDLQKAKAMEGLLDKILQFSKGVNFNFEQLADIINGKLVTVLTDLKDTLKEMNGLEVGTTKNEKSVTFSGAPSPTVSPNPNIEKISQSLMNIETALEDIQTMGLGVKVKNFDDMPS